MIVWILTLVLLGVGFYGLLAKRNLLRKVLGLAIIEHAVNLLLVLIGYRAGGVPPIVLSEADRAGFAARAVDPVPQALVLTSIVIGLALLMLMVALALRIRERTGTLDTAELRRLRG